jgi:hypothetical protein
VIPQRISLLKREETSQIVVGAGLVPALVVGAFKHRMNSALEAG